MMVATLLLISQSFLNIENKEVFYPVPAAVESSHSYDVLYYRLNFDLPMTYRYLKGAATISVRSRQNNLTRIDLHLLSPRVDSIKVDGLPATYSHQYETLYVDLPQPHNQGDSFDIMVGYTDTCSNNSLMGYLHYESSYTLSYTLGCPFDTKRWMPCYDVTWDKADHGAEFHITVPDSFTACATGQYLGRTVSQGKATYHWKHNYPISPYLLHFAVSIFKTYSDWYRPSPAESVEVKYYFWPEDSLFARNAFCLTTQMIGFYDSLFGHYPFERYGMDVLDPFFYGGMEHQTMTSIIRSWMVNADYYGIAHELSHMWWGDMVTCFTWKNVWLNEGFATYCDALYKRRREGQTAFINLMLSRRNAYFQAEAINPHPIYDPPANLLFEWGHSYCKGSWLLHMIRFLSGDDTTWLRLMSVFRDSFAYKSASSADLNRVMDQVLGGNYGWFFNEWVYDMGYPIYGVIWRKIYEPPNWRLVLDVTQTQSIGPRVFHMPLPIGVNYASGDTTITLPISESPQHFEYILSQDPLTIVVDPQNWVIQRSSITGCYESAPELTSVTRMPTVSRAINLRLTARSRIRIFDITGRKVFETITRELNYRPSNAGLYHVMIGDQEQRVVVIR